MQDLESINNFYIKILGVKDFIKQIETVEVEPKNGNKYVFGTEFPDFRQRIGELLHLRHLIIHHESFRGVLGFKRLLRMGICVIAFISVTDAYLVEKIPD